MCKRENSIDISKKRVLIQKISMLLFYDNVICLTSKMLKFFENLISQVYYVIEIQALLKHILNFYHGNFKLQIFG